jgi:hypothetical protein
MTQPFNIETELQKIISMTETVFANDEYTVNWEDILAELEECTGKGFAPSDTARFTTDIVRSVRERANHMNSHRERFQEFTATGEMAEYLTLYALCEIGIASTGENPEPFIRASLTANKLRPTRWVKNALVEAAKSNITEDGEDEIPPLIDAALLLVDESGILSALCSEARDRIEDPAWVAEQALEDAYRNVSWMAEAQP